MIKLYTMNTEILDEPGRFARCCRELSAGRREKIDRIRPWQDKKLSLAAGLLLDQGLREYGLREADMRILTGEYGKPFFPDYPNIHFSLSHSKQMAFAVFADAEVGCDIEYGREANEKIARRFFCPEEYGWMMEGGAPEERSERFFRLWTLKESFLKATGWGLSHSMDSFCLTISDSPSGREDENARRKGRVTVSRQADHARYEFEEYQFGEYSAAVCLREEEEIRV